MNTLRYRLRYYAKKICKFCGFCFRCLATLNYTRRATHLTFLKTLNLWTDDT